MAMSYGLPHKNGLTAKILVGVMVVLIASGVIGIWDIRNDVTRIGESVSQIDKRVERIENRADREQERRFYWPDIPSAR